TQYSVLLASRKIGCIVLLLGGLHETLLRSCRASRSHGCSLIGRRLAAVEGAESGWDFEGDGSFEGVAGWWAEAGMAADGHRRWLFDALDRGRPDVSAEQQGTRRRV